MNYQKFTSLIVGILFLFTAFPAYGEYKPKNRKAASGYSRGGGSRGCLSDNNSIPLTLIAPQTFVGKTASKRPVLAWYMSNSQNVRFRLFEFESATKTKQIGESKEIPTTVGINKLKLPTEYPELMVGKTYLWQIAIDCRNETILKRAEFIVVNPPSVKKEFTTIQERVDYYAENELWYEALEEALKAVSNGKLGRTGSSLVQDLAKAEIAVGAEENIEVNKKQIESLQKISNIPQIQSRFNSGNRKPASGRSRAGGGGNLTINAGSLLFNPGNRKPASGMSRAAGGGSKNINAGSFLLNPGNRKPAGGMSRAAGGGNITINADNLQLDDGTITDQSYSDSTSNIEINVKDNFNADNEQVITSSQQISALIANSCIARSTKRQENSFTITGSDGLRNSPVDGFVSKYSTGDVPNVSENQSSEWKKGEPIIESHGVYQLALGELILSRECK